MITSRISGYNTEDNRCILSTNKYQWMQQSTKKGGKQSRLHTRRILSVFNYIYIYEWKQVTNNHNYNTFSPYQTDRRFLLCLWSLMAVTQSLMDPSALILHAEGNPTTDLLGIMMQAVSHEQAKRCKAMLSFPNNGIWGAWSHLSKIQWVTLYTCLWLSSHQTLWSSNLGCDILMSQ